MIEFFPFTLQTKILTKSIENLLDDLGRADLVEVVARVGTVQEGHHLEPVQNGALLFEEFAS